MRVGLLTDFASTTSGGACLTVCNEDDERAEALRGLPPTTTFLAEVMLRTKSSLLDIDGSGSRTVKAQPKIDLVA